MMNVLSLFDGMSGAQLALQKLGVKHYTYYASEVDKYAIAVTQNNFPNTIQLGDVTKIKGDDLPEIDLLVGGFPCQSYSFSGKQGGFQDDRGKLFFECVRLLHEVKPKYFLFENVKMKKEYQNEISKLFGVEPIEINSSLLSAQNRQRLYWTNIPGVGQPMDKGILLRDIIHEGEVDRDKSHCIDANYYKGGNLKSYFEKNIRQLVFEKLYYKPYFKEYSEKDSKGCVGYVGNSPKQATRVYDVDGKSVALCANGGGQGGKTGLYKFIEGYIRKLTPTECEKLQTVPVGYTLVLDENGKQVVSNTQRYKMLGNGFTVDVIAHILKGVLL